MKPPHTTRPRGFTLIELMITVAIVALLASVALPSYNSQIVRTRRAAAAGCLAELAQFMERVYAAGIRYDQVNGSATTLPSTACRTDLQASYSFGFVTGQLATRTFQIEAVPLGSQAKRDAACGSLRIDQANVRSVTGTQAAAQCWR